MAGLEVIGSAFRAQPVHSRLPSPSHAVPMRVAHAPPQVYPRDFYLHAGQHVGPPRDFRAEV
jgi:hypothetical protein